MYEPHQSSLLPRAQFLRRLRRHGTRALGIFLISIAGGIAGFHWLAREEWIDAYLDATMLLGGMGPVGKYDCCPAGKIFAGLYALYAGVVFLGAGALLIAPVVHRVIHKLRLDEEQSDN